MEIERMNFCREIGLLILSMNRDIGIDKLRNELDKTTWSFTLLEGDHYKVVIA